MFFNSLLGDGYVEALRSTWPKVPESADFVMYWWHHAAVLTARGALQRFGFITTNSIRQTFNRRVIEMALRDVKASSLLPPGEGARRADEGTRTRSAPRRETEPSPGAARHPLPGGEGKATPLSLAFAIPDHPWVDTADGAAVRIAMTVADRGEHAGRLLEVVGEHAADEGEVAVELREQHDMVHADLSAGANVSGVKALASNARISATGVIPHGAGMMVSFEVASSFEKDAPVKPYRNGKDLTAIPRGVLVIDCYGLTSEQVRLRFPRLYQWLVDRVKPERDANRDRDLREKWWLHRRSNEEMRRAIANLSRYIVTVMTAKHRVFQFLDASIFPDQMLVVVGSDDAFIAGVLSSSIHVVWALATGSHLGVGNDPRYNKLRCFDAFPFPAISDAVEPSPSRGGLGGDGLNQAASATSPHPPPTSPLKGEALVSRIRDLGEQLDAHRKRQQALHPELTLTGMYNVLEKLRSGEALTAKERTIHEQGLVSVLRQLHDELDAAVLDAYGWSDLLPLLRVAHGNNKDFVAPAKAGAQFQDDAVQRLDSGLRRNDEQNPLSLGDARRMFDEAILERLVALNAERAAEEARGLVRWLRPGFQHPTGETAPQQSEIDTAEATATVAATVHGRPRPWPRDAIEQVRAVAGVLAASAAPLSPDEIAAHFTARGGWKKRLPPMLDMLSALGRAREHDGRYSAL